MRDLPVSFSDVQHPKFKINLIPISHFGASTKFNSKFVFQISKFVSCYRKYCIVIFFGCVCVSAPGNIVIFCLLHLFFVSD